MMRVLGFVALLALAACAVPPAPPPGPPAPTAVLTPQAPMVFPPEPAPAPPPQPVAPPPAEIVVLPPPAQPLPPPPPPTLTLTDLVGKPRTDILTLLGGPDQARTEAGAEVLLYQGDSCTLFVFLYEPQGGGTHRVEHAEVGPRGRDLTRDAACLTGLLRRGAAG
jgi:hypothetical protein